VRDQLITAGGAGTVLTACKEDVGADRESARMVPRRDQIRVVVGVQPCRAGRLGRDVR
jgi:hypothetical protein